MLIKVMREKIFKISNNILCAVAGITSDANVMIEKLRDIAATHMSNYAEDIPVEQLVRRLSDIKQYYTQIGGTDEHIFIVELFLFVKFRQTPVWCLIFVCRLGCSSWIPALPIRPEWQLHGLACHLHWQEPPGHGVAAQNGIQGR
jgi:hypothetical protein